METLGSKLNWETCWWRWSVTGLHGGEISPPLALHCFVVCWLLHVCLDAAHTLRFWISLRSMNVITVDDASTQARKECVHDPYTATWVTYFGYASSWLCNSDISATLAFTRKKEIRCVSSMPKKSRAWVVSNSTQRKLNLTYSTAFKLLLIFSC